MRESPYQKKCLKWLKDVYGESLFVANIHGDGWSNKGFPDLLLSADGKAVFIELKGESGYKLQPDQQVMRNRILKSGTPHYVIRNDFERFKNTVRKEFPNEAEKEIQQP